MGEIELQLVLCSNLPSVLTDVKGADGEGSGDQLIHHHLSCHRPDSAPRQHPLQPPQPVVVEVGMETEADGGHSSGLPGVDASPALSFAEHALLDEVGGGEEGGVSENVADVGLSFEQGPGPPHGQSGRGKLLVLT